MDKLRSVSLARVAAAVDAAAVSVSGRCLGATQSWLARSSQTSQPVGAS